MTEGKCHETDVDTDACQGYGLCQAAAPALLDLDDDGYARLIGDSVPTSEHNHAHDAVNACPARALRVRA
ncbi:ferredoxin [Mycobacterium stomatepiae]|nr:ferredoxin [Mycobacterium stomatepiae]